MTRKKIGKYVLLLLWGVLDVTKAAHDALNKTGGRKEPSTNTPMLDDNSNVMHSKK